MASVVEKLYPPIIGSSIPACYKNDSGTVVITVPFSMNRAVDSSLISSMRLKIKTVQSNTYLKTLEVDNLSEALNSRIATFYWTDEEGSNLSKIKIGQYLKVQLAYVGKDSADAVGYFSTVAVVKYTSKPTVYIEGMGEDANQIQAFKTNYVGVFETGEDKSERPYSYNFYLYDSSGNIVETSGWTLHNTSINNIASESLSLDRTTDSYTFQTLVDVNKEYYLQYGVRTINNLEVFSPIYTCLEPYVGPSQFYTDLVATNNFEEGYIELSLKMKSDEELLDMFEGDSIETDDETNIKTIKDSNDQVIKVISYESPENPISIEICRAERTDNYTTWRTLQKIYFTDYATALNWSFRDLTIEQGITYQYCFRQYNDAGIQSSRTMSNRVYADFEDMFLWDGKRQLKIRFNPKMSSFKIDRLESKMDTIGSRYPFFFRNGIVEYREFPIAGLISYLADNNEMFLNYEEDLNIIRGPNAERISGTPVNQNENDTSLGKSWELSETLNSVGYNVYAERVFKMKLLEWLGNGEIKLFKSSTEGNFLVRLMNVSLSPEEKLGRMLHNFSCTAYEVETLTYENLIDLGFIVPVDEEEKALEMETVFFKDKIDNISNSILINNNVIVNYMYISPSTNVVGGPGFYVRLGADSADRKTYIQPGFVIKADNSTLPSVWFNANDNFGLLEELNLTQDLDGIKSLVGDAVLTYEYYRTSAAIGELYNIENVHIRNEIQTIIGPITKTFAISSAPSEGVAQTEEVLQFFVLNFKHKEIREITENNGNYYDASNNQLSTFDLLCLYKINDNYYYASNDGASLQSVSSEGLDTIRLVDGSGKETVFNEVPILSLNGQVYSQIQIGAGLYLECAYQAKITTYEVG